MSQERPSRPSRHARKKQRVQAEPELSESDEYVDFTEPRHEPMEEYNTVIVGDETETSSAVQSIQQVGLQFVRKGCKIQDRLETDVFAETEAD